MQKKLNKLIVKKFDGDDQYSFAVFRRKDVRGLGSTIFWGEANPIVSGLSRHEARAQKQDLEKRMSLG